jgi:hypothetical protein
MMKHVIALVLLSGCAVFASPREKVKLNLAKRGEVLAEWTDDHGYEHLLVRKGEVLNDYYIRTHPYVEAELTGKVDPDKGHCVAILRSNGSGWTKRPGGRYRYEHATKINDLRSDCSEYRGTPAWKHVKETLSLPDE